MCRRATNPAPAIPTTTSAGTSVGSGSRRGEMSVMLRVSRIEWRLGSLGMQHRGVPSEYVRNQPDFFAVGPASAPAAIDMGAGIWCSPGMSSTYLITTAAERIVVNTGMWFEARTHKRNYDA